MKLVLQIFRRDVKRLFKNWAAVLVVMGVCLIPSLYAWFNIAANYDPYGNTGQLKIAVANMDQGTENELTGKLQAGNKIVDNLKENHDLGWVFTDQDTAVNGVRSGEYYAAIVIPEDFSASLTSILDGKLQQPQFIYYLNEKKNAVAPKITDTGAATIQEKVNTTFVQTASEAVAELVESAFSDAAGSLDTLQQNLLKDIESVQTNIKEYEKVSLDFQKMTDTEQTTQDIESILDQVKKAALTGEAASDKTGEIITAGRTNAAEFTALLTETLTEGRALLADMADKADHNFNAIDGEVQRIGAKLDSAEATASELLEKNERLIKALQKVASQFPESKVQVLLQALEEENSRYQSLLASIQAGRENLENVVSIIGNASGQIRGSIQQEEQLLEQGKSQWESDVLPELNRTLDSAAELSGKISATLGRTGPMTEQLKEILENMDQSLQDARQLAGSTEKAVASVQDILSGISSDLNLLQSSQTYQELQNIQGMDAEAISDFMSSPVQLSTTTFYPVENYGSAMSPFYTNLAIWVGGIVLIAIFKLETDHDKTLEKFSAVQGFFGRWLLFIVVGLIQSLIICLGDLYLLKIQCISPMLLIIAGMVSSFVYVTIIFSLSITFKHIGKALCILLVIIQIPGSAGTYPIEMTPEFFQNLHPLLPFTYGINAMREAIAGVYGWHYLQDLLCLALYVPIFLLIGVCIRPLLLNLNRMFDDRLAQTEVMICEKGMPRERLKLSAAVKILAEDQTFRVEIAKKAERFEQKYKKRVRNGVAAIAILPVIFLVLMFSVNSKMIFLILWIAAVVGVAGYLICLEYIRESIRRQREMIQMSESELKKRFRDHTKEEEG